MSQLLSFSASRLSILSVAHACPSLSAFDICQCLNCCHSRLQACLHFLRRIDKPLLSHIFSAHTSSQNVLVPCAPSALSTCRPPIQYNPTTRDGLHDIQQGIVRLESKYILLNHDQITGSFHCCVIIIVIVKVQRNHPFRTPKVFQSTSNGLSRAVCAVDELELLGSSTYIICPHGALSFLHKLHNNQKLKNNYNDDSRHYLQAD
jgi:hypothetical protein